MGHEPTPPPALLRLRHVEASNSREPYPEGYPRRCRYTLPTVAPKLLTHAEHDAEPTTLGFAQEAGAIVRENSVLCRVPRSKRTIFAASLQGIFKVAECYREGQGSRAYALNDSARSAAMSAAHFQLFQCGSRAGWHAWLRRRPVRWCVNSVQSSSIKTDHFCSRPQGIFNLQESQEQPRAN